MNSELARIAAQAEGRAAELRARAIVEQERAHRAIAHSDFAETERRNDLAARWTFAADELRIVAQYARSLLADRLAAEPQEQPANPQART